jgi:hypothetical protein
MKGNFLVCNTIAFRVNPKWEMFHRRHERASAVLSRAQWLRLLSRSIAVAAQSPPEILNSCARAKHSLIAFVRAWRAFAVVSRLLLIGSFTITPTLSCVGNERVNAAFGPDRIRHDLQVFRELLASSQIEADARSSKLCDDVKGSITAGIGPKLEFPFPKDSGQSLFRDAISSTRKYRDMCPNLWYEEYRWLESDIVRGMRSRENRYRWEDFRYADRNVEFYELQTTGKPQKEIIIFRGTGLCSHPDIRPGSPACQEDILFTIFDTKCDVIERHTYSGYENQDPRFPQTFDSILVVKHPSLGLGLLEITGPSTTGTDQQPDWHFGITAIPKSKAENASFYCRAKQYR